MYNGVDKRYGFRLALGTRNKLLTEVLMTSTIEFIERPYKLYHI
jgi:hypothetical protein